MKNRQGEIMRYRKRPVTIEALKFDGTLSSLRVIQNYFQTIDTLACDINSSSRVTFWKIATLEGGHIVSVGDYVIRGIKGEYYPCKPDIFEMTYEPIESQTQEPRGEING